jgi:hypothetical protein
MRPVEPGVPLSYFLDNEPRTRLRLWCSALPCTYSEAHDLAPVVVRLCARGVDGHRLGIRELGALVNKDCPSCRRRNWEARPDWPQPTMGLGH